MASQPQDMGGPPGFSGNGRPTSRAIPIGQFRFPENIRTQITGHIRLVPSHGATEMPYWRTSLNAPSSVPATTLMDALLDYLSSIQLKEFGPYRGPTPQTLAAAGRPLFETHCVGCHGKDGRGQQISGYTVGLATDLTSIASRNAGAFELRHVYESIARCGDDWTKSEMPSWSHAFKRRGWGDYLTMKNIEALATYIEAIQR
jgi:mono/diheme cytochrome c family protein